MAAPAAAHANIQTVFGWHMDLRWGGGEAARSRPLWGRSHVPCSGGTRGACEARGGGGGTVYDAGPMPQRAAPQRPMTRSGGCQTRGGGGGGYDAFGVFWSTVGSADWPIATSCPSLGPFRSIGGGAYGAVGGLRVPLTAFVEADSTQHLRPGNWNSGGTGTCATVLKMQTGPEAAVGTQNRLGGGGGRGRDPGITNTQGARPMHPTHVPQTPPPPCVTCSPPAVSLRGPGQSPVYSSPHDAVSIFS